MSYKLGVWSYKLGVMSYEFFQLVGVLKGCYYCIFYKIVNTVLTLTAVANPVSGYGILNDIYNNVARNLFKKCKLLGINFLARCCILY